MNKLTLAGLAVTLAAGLGCHKDKGDSLVSPQPQPVQNCKSEKLELYETLDSHFSKMNASQLPNILKGGVLSTTLGNTAYEQFLSPHGMIDFADDERDEVEAYHFVNDGEKVFTYELSFPAGLKSVRKPDFSLPDFVGQQVNILGKEYKIDAATFYDDGLMKLKFTSLDGLTEIVLADWVSDGFGYPGANVNFEFIEDAEVAFEGSFANNIVDLRKINYRLNADAWLGDVYVPAGSGLRAQLAEPEGMLSPGWDIKFDGMTPSVQSPILLYASSNGYRFNFFNKEGINYDTALLENVGGQVGYSRNNGANKFHFVEGVPIKVGDRFIVNKPGSDLTHILEYDTFNAQTNQLTFQDIGTGDREVSCPNPTTNMCDIVVGGVTYVFQFNPIDGSVLMDLNGNSQISNLDSVYMVNQYDGKIRLGETDDPSGSRSIKVTIPASKIDGAKCTGLDEDVIMLFNAVGPSVEGFFPLQESGKKLYDENMLAYRLMTRYGVHAVQSSLSPAVLDIAYPQVQRIAQVRFEP